MNNINIIGGVSPLKARQATRGGEYAGAATRTAKRRGGYGKSTGVRGAGGRNVGGYNVRTRFTSRGEWQKPASGGTTYIPTKPYSFDKDGKVVVNPLEGYDYRQDPSTTTSTRKSKGTFDEVWAANENNFQAEWDSKEQWIKQAQKEIDEGYYDTKTVDGQKWRRSYTKKDADAEKVYTSDWEKY
jgi:hypothetical protein